MKDYKLKFANRAEALSVLSDYVVEDAIVSIGLVTILDVGVVSDPDPASTEELPLPGIPRAGYYLLVRDMGNSFSIDPGFLTTDNVYVAFAGKLPVPVQVTNGQFRDALTLSGISLAAVGDAINAISDPLQKQFAITRWEYANHIERHHPIIAALAPTFGFTEETADDLFRLADTL